MYINSDCEENKTIINSIRICITDVFGKIINIKNADTKFRLIIKKMIKIHLYLSNIMWVKRDIIKYLEI